MDPIEPNAAAAVPDATPPSLMGRIDAWMAANPWHPRIVPFFVYILFMAAIGFVSKASLWVHPFLYAAQCLSVAWLLWRYRRLMPELTVRFHWSAIPTGVLALVLWLGLGMAMIHWLPGLFGPTLTANGTPEPHDFQRMGELSPGLMWTSLIFRLLGMSLLVPLFEELFVRSLCLRSFHRFRRTGLGVLQLIHDMPLIGEWLEGTKLGHRVAKKPPVFGPEFERTPLGALSVFGVAASTFVFMINHVPRDYAGCIAVGVLWCLMVGWTNNWGREGGRKFGLGPVVWSHGITNALLWAWTLWTDNWQFL